MASPPKPWESSVPSTNAAPLAPASSNTTTSTFNTAAAPEIPRRPIISTNYGQGSGYGAGYSSYGAGYGSGYGTGMYGSGYGSGMYGGGMYGSGYGTGMYGGGMYGNRMGMMNRPFNRMMDENSLTQQMELSTQSTFQVLDQIVQSFMGFSNMLESTFFATHSSFMAMVGVAEQFGHLKTYLGEVFSIVSLYQTIKNTLYRMSGRSPPNVPASNPSTPKPSKKPLFVFIALVLGVPYLISMLMKHIKPKALDIKSIEFCKSLYDFHSDQPGELSFVKGDLIAILGKIDPEWWKGRTQDGRIGLFPRSYVQVIPKQVETVPGNDFASEFQTPNNPINIA